MADTPTYEGTPMPEGMAPIDWLKPGTQQHVFVLDYIKTRIRYSEQKMSTMYSRWRKNELMLQAYIGLGDYDAMLKSMSEAKTGPGISDSAVAINVPFAWATVNTIVTYLLHMFAGRRPIFGVTTYRSEQVNRSKNMETYLQYNADVVKFVRALYFFLMDGETYGLAILRTMWKQESKTRVLMVPPTPEIISIAGASGLQAQPQRREEEYISFEGNSCTNVDPFMFFPDPRVPMHEVNEKGEWVAWRAFMGKHQLLREQAKGRLKWVDKSEPRSWDSDDGGGSQNSYRGMRAIGLDASSRDERMGSIAPNYQVDQGSFEIIPKDLGLGTSEVPEKWLFTMLNKNTIVQAVPIELATGKHPVEVAEPNSVGYSFGHLGTVDMLGPMQELMSWFMNSHIYNVRASLNNMFVYDPTKIETQDLQRPGAGKLIRLKNTAFGLNDPKMAIQQLQVSDVTRSHIADFQMFGRMASDLTGATDNARGLQDQGGRKTATEIRTSSEAGASRLAAKGKIYSVMAFTGLAETWSVNAQQNLTEAFETSILGSAAAGADSIRISPESIQGDFVFPVHDGTLPADKLGMLEVWRQIFETVLTEPTGQLRQSYDVIEMFDFIATLGGATNIKNFKLNVVPQTQQMNALGAGNGVPMDAAMAGLMSAAGR